ncbi:MAG TPA: rRNA adenine N-6-methyltransferase family protein [Flavobacterium sp.]|jgi:phospholipid N-methyltransferase
MSIFFQQAIANIKQTGSFIPSSDFLATKMVDKIDFNKNLNILELGAGEGIFTRHILAKITAKSSLTSCEINSSLFTEIAKIRDHRFKPKMECVFDRYIYDSFVQCSVDCIISAIPLANIKRKKKKYLLDSCFELLKPGGLFVQFQYLPQDYKRIKKTFGNIKLGFTLFNFPPAFIYYAYKPLENKKVIEQKDEINILNQCYNYYTMDKVQ